VARFKDFANDAFCGDPSRKAQRINSNTPTRTGSAVTRKRVAAATSHAVILESAAHGALEVARKAHRHSKSLAGNNYYGNKLLELRANAANAFRDLSSQSPGDTAALAELIERVFAPTTDPKDRLAASRELTLSLRTTWKQSAAPAQAERGTTLFPATILARTKRGYIASVGRQMNGCYESGWYDACAVMMRRLIEISIIEAYEGKGIAAKIQDGSGNFFQLSDLISAALSEPQSKLSRNAKSALPKLRDVGHRSAHGRYFNADPNDIEHVRDGCRVVVEEFLHHAGLL
jgi:hypothetical protein